MLVSRGLAAAFVAALVLTTACTPAKRFVPPKRDQVAFFERPDTLEAARRSARPAPLVVLLGSDPWAMVIGSDSPAFALYDDGTVIRRSGAEFLTSRLTRSEQNKLLKRLRIDAMRPLYGHFDAAAGVTDQPSQSLLLYAGETPIFISVYGSLDQASIRSKVPQIVVEAYDALKGFDAPGKSWLPHYVEVMIWPYEYAPGPSIKWPGDWPDLDDPKTIRRGEDSRSIFVPSSQLDELQAFLRRRHEKGAIEIGGRKWAASIRYPFPHEQLWMAPNPEVKKSER